MSCKGCLEKQVTMLGLKEALWQLTMRAHQSDMRRSTYGSEVTRLVEYAAKCIGDPLPPDQRSTQEE